jgi:hypothetical protein
VHDAPVVSRLRAAGAVLIGRTNMTEFAFSGVGINPHYGTPGNPYDRRLIPGGSSSGAAVSVSDRLTVSQPQGAASGVQSAPWITNPPYWALREKTVNVGLRRAGFPDE